MKKKLSNTTKIVLAVALFLLVVNVIVSVVFINVSYNGTKSILNRKMLEFAQTAARLVDGDDIKMLTIDDKNNQTEAYTKNYNVLSAFKTNADEKGADLAYIYCLVKNAEGNIVFSIDPSDEPGEFLVESPVITTKAMTKAMEGVAGVDDKAYVDRWGKLYSAYAPIYTSDNQVAGIIGVDVWAKWFENQLVTNAVTVSSISVSTIAFGIMFSILFTTRLRKRFKELNSSMASLEVDLQTLIQEIRGSEEEEKASEEVKSESGDAIVVLREKIHTAQTELKKYIEYSQRRAYSDTLTGLNNRRAYFERVSAINARMKEDTQVYLSVLVYDVNGLKDINDEYGHEFGDSALVSSAAIIKEVYGSANAYRIGGDEFVIILENITPNEFNFKNDTFLEKIKSFNEGKHKLKFEVSLSRGSSLYDKKTDKEFIDVFRRADKDMYKNKKIYHDQHDKKSDED